MPDIRTTRVALLVDREVDRDVQTSRIALLVDRETDVDIIVENIYLIADIEHDVDLTVEDVYLVADIEDGYPWGDIFDQTSDFTFTIDAGDAETWEDVDAWEDLFTQELVPPENWTDEDAWSDKFDQVYVLQDTWDQQDTHRALRSDLWQLYQDIVSYINTYGLSTPVPPGPAEYDIDDNGRIQTSDAMLVHTWWLYGVISKNLRTTDAWSIHYHNWPNIPRTWSETWTQTQVFHQSLQHLDFNNHFTQTDLWYNPGDVPILLPNIQTQLDSYTVSMDLNRFSDNLIQEDVFDPSFPAKVRAWADNFNQSDRFDDTNLAHAWVQLEEWILGETKLLFQHHWVQTPSLKPPHALQFSHTWTHTQLYDPHTILIHFEHAWIHTGSLQVTSQYAQWEDYWYHTDTFQPPVPVTLSLNWEQQDLFRANIQTVHVNDTLDMIPRHHSMTQDVYIYQNASMVPEYVMLNWFLAELEPLRHLQDTINWHEQWRITLPVEELDDIQEPVDEFEANPLWEDLSLTWTPIEDWDQVTGISLTNNFNQEQEFIRSHDPNLFLDDTQIFADTFNSYGGATGLTLGTMIDTDIEVGDDNLDVEYPEGQIPVGTQFTMDGVSGVFIVLATIETGGYTTNITFSPALQLGNLPQFNALMQFICPITPEGMFTLTGEGGSLELRNPHWGNRIVIEQTRVVGATRSGTPYVGRRPYWPQRTTYTYTISHLTYEQFDAILDFLEQNLAKPIHWTDHYGETYFGFCLEPASPVRRRSRRRGEIQLTLTTIEGEVMS